MKFSLIPHFVVGLYMYTNSSIITPTDIDSYIYSYIQVNSQYLNSKRFANLHSAIFLIAFAVILAIYILKATVYQFLRSIFCGCCSKITKRLLPQSSVSDDFYGDLTPLQLCKEFNSTSLEKKKYSEIIRVGKFRKENKA